MTLKTELKSSLLPLLIFQMFLLTLLDWNPRVSRLSLANLNDRGKRDFLSQGGGQGPDGHSDRVPALLCEERRIFQKYDHFCTVPLQQAYMVLWPDGFHSLVKGTWSLPKVTWRTLKTWETKIKLTGLNIQRKPSPTHDLANAIHTLGLSRNCKTSQGQGMVNAVIHREILHVDNTQ